MNEEKEMTVYTEADIRVLENVIYVNALKAARNPENLLEDGTPNWNFVDADAYMDTLDQYKNARDLVEAEFYNLFDGVCFAVDKALEAA
jgi:hypothetical protein